MINAHAILDRASLLAHYIYAEEIKSNPALIDLAKTLIDEAISDHGGTTGQQMWLALFQEPWDKVEPKMLADDAKGRLLRSNSPFPLIIGIREEGARRQLWRKAKHKLAMEAIVTAIPDYAKLAQDITAAFPPHGERPQFDIPRFWSNPSLNDPERIIALVITTPTVEDLARTIQAYGPDKVTETLAGMIASNELPEERQTYIIDHVRTVLNGVAQAARQSSTDKSSNTN